VSALSTATVIVSTVILSAVMSLSAARELEASPERLFLPVGVEAVLLEDLSNLFSYAQEHAHLEPFYHHLPTLSLGGASKGRLLFGHKMRSAWGLRVMVSEDSYTTPEVALSLYAVNSLVRRLHPGGPDLMVLDISQDGGGKFKPHKTHQNGGDVDLRYYIKGVPPNDHEKRFVHPSKLDLKRMWAFLKILKRYELAEVIFIDLSLQKVLYQYGLSKLKMSKRELGVYLSYPRKSKGGALVKHVSNHYHHLHVRFNLGSSHEWWPLALKEADELQTEYLRHRTGYFEHVVQSGETLGAIAAFNRVRLRDLLKWNQMSETSIIRPGQALKVWR